jgi:hypothetical protein
MNKAEVPGRITEITGYRAKWARPIFEYAGCERTIEIFGAPVKFQLEMLKSLREVRSELESAAGGPLVFIFK